MSVLWIVSPRLFIDEVIGCDRADQKFARRYLSSLCQRGLSSISGRLSRRSFRIFPQYCDGSADIFTWPSFLSRASLRKIVKPIESVVGWFDEVRDFFFDAWFFRLSKNF